MGHALAEEGPSSGVPGTHGDLTHPGVPPAHGPVAQSQEVAMVWTLQVTELRLSKIANLLANWLVWG